MKSTKILFGLGLLIFFAFITALFAISLLHLQKPATSNSNSNVKSTNAPVSVLTAAEVAKHNTAQNCWMIVNGKVYDLTSLVYSHSGGSQAILQDCGKDGSVGFNTKYGQGGHSSNANSILNSFYLGDLNQQIGTSELQNKTTAISNTSIPQRRGGDNAGEYDD